MEEAHLVSRKGKVGIVAVVVAGGGWLGYGSGSARGMLRNSAADRLD